MSGIQPHTYLQMLVVVAKEHTFGRARYKLASIFRNSRVEDWQPQQGGNFLTIIMGIFNLHGIQWHL